MSEGRSGRYLSQGLLALAAVGCLYYLGLPSFAPPVAGAQRTEPGRGSSFHGAEPLPASGSACEACHGRAPHRRTPRARAFLNLHAQSLACGVCHLTGAGLVRRQPSPAAAGQKGSGPAAGIAVGRVRDGRWEVVDLPGQGIELRTSGPQCAECHRRGSPILAEGYFDAYRRRLLEELALFYRLGRSTP